MQKLRESKRSNLLAVSDISVKKLMLLIYKQKFKFAFYLLFVRVVTLTRKRNHIDFKVALFTWAFRHSGKTLNPLLTDYLLTRSLRFAEELLRVVPWTKLSSTSAAFSVSVPKLWNTLPVDIKISNTMSISRKLLKSYLHKQACEH